MLPRLCAALGVTILCAARGAAFRGPNKHLKVHLRPFRRRSSDSDMSFSCSRSSTPAWGVTVYGFCSTIQRCGREQCALAQSGEGGRVANGNGAAGETRAGVASLLRVGVVAATEVVDARVEDDTAADDGARSAQAQLAVSDVEDDCAVVVGNDVAQVSDVADLVLRSAVGAVERVVVTSSGETARSRDISELVDVETVSR